MKNNFCLTSYQFCPIITNKTCQIFDMQDFVHNTRIWWQSQTEGPWIKVDLYLLATPLTHMQDGWKVCCECQSSGFSILANTFEYPVRVLNLRCRSWKQSCPWQKVLKRKSFLEGKFRIFSILAFLSYGLYHVLRRQYFTSDLVSTLSIWDKYSVIVCSALGMSL